MRITAGLFTSLALVALLCLVGACAESEKRPKVSLQKVSSCEALGAHLKSAAIAEMKATLTNWYYYSMGLEERVEGGCAPAAVMGLQGVPRFANAGPYVLPNRLENEDERRLTRFAGDRIYTVIGDSLHAMKVRQPGQIELSSSVRIDGTPARIIVDNERLVLISTLKRSNSTGAAYCDDNVVGSIVVTIVDVSDVSRIKAVRESVFQGSLVSASLLEGSVRLVIQDRFRWQERVRWSMEGVGDWSDHEAAKKALALHVEENERAIMEVPLQEWVPSMERAVSGLNNLVEPVPFACEDFYLDNGSPSAMYTEVVELRLIGPYGEMEHLSVVGRYGGSSFDSNSFYLLSHQLRQISEGRLLASTHVHQFAIGRHGGLSYGASGQFDGRLATAHSIDTKDGFLRVAVNVDEYQRSEGGWHPAETASLIHVFTFEKNELRELGRSEPLEVEGRIFDAYFAGDRAMLSLLGDGTPIYVMDMSRPHRPMLGGTLPIVGSSASIVPVAGQRFAIVGPSVERAEPGEAACASREVQLASVDLSDLSNLQLDDVQDQGDECMRVSEIGNDNRGFRYFSERGLLSLPYSELKLEEDASGGLSEVRFFRLSAGGGLEPAGALSLSDWVRVDTTNPLLQTVIFPHDNRVVMAVDFIYAFSDVGVRVAHMSAPEKVLTTVLFDEPEVDP